MSIVSRRENKIEMISSPRVPERTWGSNIEFQSMYTSPAQYSVATVTLFLGVTQQRVEAMKKRRLEGTGLPLDACSALKSREKKERHCERLEQIQFMHIVNQMWDSCVKIAMTRQPSAHSHGRTLARTCKMGIADSNKLIGFVELISLLMNLVHRFQTHWDPPVCFWC